MVELRQVRINTWGQMSNLQRGNVRLNRNPIYWPAGEQTLTQTESWGGGIVVNDKNNVALGEFQWFENEFQIKDKTLKTTRGTAQKVDTQKHRKRNAAGPG